MKETQMAPTEMMSRLRELHEELSAINDDLTATDAVDEQTVDAGFAWRRHRGV